MTTIDLIDHRWFWPAVRLWAAFLLGVALPTRSLALAGFAVVLACLTLPSREEVA